MTIRVIVYLLLAGIVLALGAAVGHTWTRSAAYAEGHKDGTAQATALARIARAEAMATAQQAARDKEAADQRRTEDAQRSRIETQHAVDLAAARNRDVLDSLRDDLARTRADLPTASAEAVRAYAATATVVLERCTRRYIDVAQAADSHAADALMFDRAWPVEAGAK